LVLNADKPATKMFVCFSKARDDESRRTICLDFDPKVGRVSDPEYGAGSVQAVEAMSKELFDNQTPEEDMVSDDNLFKEAEKAKKENIKEDKKDVKEEKDPQDHIEDVIDESNIEGDKDNSSSSDEFLAEEKPKEVVKEPPKEVIKEERKKGQDLAEKTIGEQSIDDVLGLI
jgi:FKBP-type peptidyl-prolyl cis-trans isomerase